MNKYSLDNYDNLLIRTCKKSLNNSELLRRIRKIWKIRTICSIKNKRIDWIIASYLFELLEKRNKGGIKASHLAFQLCPENEWRILNPDENFTYEEKAILIACGEIAHSNPNQWYGFKKSAFWRN